MVSSQDTHEMRLEGFLDALTDDTLDGETDLWGLAVRYDIPAAEAQSLADLVTQINTAFDDEDGGPSKAFKQQLRLELTGEPDVEGMFARWQKLPLRLRIAAGVALLAALTLLGRKRMLAQTRSVVAQLRRAQAEGGEVELLA
jgi:hypothetical protein